MAARRSDAEALPPPLRFVALPLAIAVLFLLFLHLGFPYDRLAERLADRLGHATQLRIQIAQIEPRLSLAGPGIDVIGVTATPRAGARIELERAFLRPAWSWSWLRGDPALRVVAESVELEKLPLAAALPGVSLRGPAELRLLLVFAEQGLEGASRIHARDGSLQLPAVPVPLPFTNLEVELDFGGENRIALESARLTGPLVSLLASGTLGHGDRFQNSPLSLEIEITAEPGLQAPLQAAGIRFAPDGKARLQLSGTPERPEIR